MRIVLVAWTLLVVRTLLSSNNRNLLHFHTRFLLARAWPLTDSEEQLQGLSNSPCLAPRVGQAPVLKVSLLAVPKNRL